MVILATEGFLGTLIVGIIVAAIVVIAVGSMIRDKKQGKSLQCGCKCSECKCGCGGSCGSAAKEASAEKTVNEEK